MTESLHDIVDDVTLLASENKVGIAGILPVTCRVKEFLKEPGRYRIGTSSMIDREVLDKLKKWKRSVNCNRD